MIALHSKAKEALSTLPTLSYTAKQIQECLHEVWSQVPFMPFIINYLYRKLEQHVWK